MQPEGCGGVGGRAQSPAAGCCGSEPHVLHPAAPVSAGCSSLAAGRSYSEPRSMGESRGLGDSHGRRVGRRAAGREEQVGFFRRFPHPSPHPVLKGFSDADVFLVSFPAGVAV